MGQEIGVTPIQLITAVSAIANGGSLYKPHVVREIKRGEAARASEDPTEPVEPKYVIRPQTAATLQKNLAVIDQAIGESRAALRVQPTSEPAQQSLIENFKTKIAFLQDTVALINEMRKGNDTGAARIVSGLKQKGD